MLQLRLGAAKYINIKKNSNEVFLLESEYCLDYFHIALGSEKTLMLGKIERRK